MNKTSDRPHAQDHTAAAAPPPAPPAPPVPKAPPSRASTEPRIVQALSDKDRARADELSANTNRSPQEEKELNDLVARQQGVIPVEDRPEPLNPEEQKRLVELRAKRDAGGLDDAGVKEMDALGRREAEAAGHGLPSPPKDATPAEVHADLMTEMLMLIEHAVDMVPQLAGLRSSILRLRGRVEQWRGMNG